MVSEALKPSLSRSASPARQTASVFQMPQYARTRTNGREPLFVVPLSHSCWRSANAGSSTRSTVSGSKTRSANRRRRVPATFAGGHRPGSCANVRATIVHASSTRRPWPVA